MTPVPRTRTHAHSPRILAATLAVAATSALGPAVAHGGGGAPSSDLVILSVTGPGEMRTTSDNFNFFIRNEGVFRWAEPPAFLTLAADHYGNDAEFAGWQGDCANEGLNPTCTVLGPASIGFARAASGQGAMATPETCRWVGAAFKYPGQPTPVMRNQCAAETPGGGGGGGGGGSNPGGGSGTPGGGSNPGSGGQATPTPGNVLPGGVTTVRKAPPLTRTRVSVTGNRLGTTGTAPRGTTRVVQSLALVGSAGVNVAGRCRLTRATGAFTCAASPPRGRWTVITQARKGSTVIAQTTRTVRVR